MPETRPTDTAPGAYTEEKSAFPPPVVGVRTAVPAFVGYTEKAEIAGKPAIDVPIPIHSLAEYEERFGKGFTRGYTITQVADPATGAYNFRVLDPTLADPAYRYYALAGDGIAFNLYNSMRLFYANGGGECYVVSVGGYMETAGSLPATASTIAADRLIRGLAAIAEQRGPTMLVVPDAVLLAADPPPATPWTSSAFASVARAMLAQCERLRDRVALLDVYGTELLTPPARNGATLMPVIESFQSAVGDRGLSYGIAYFPFLNTTVVPSTDVAYDSLYIGDSTPEGGGLLQQILTWETTRVYGDSARASSIIADINRIGPGNTPEEVEAINANLTAGLDLLTRILGTAVARESVLPPSAAMAGVMTRTDQTRGVWTAPANVTLEAVASPSVALDNAEQGDLNAPVNGKAVDVLREFPGRGTVVWGARTLDGNSPDYRYVQARRTLIYIEQSIEAALIQFIFAPNNGQTWATVVATVSSFLTGVWSAGGLMGATPNDAFTVQCGLGSTMTGKDILDGYMLVQVTLQLLRPAEFIELTFKQAMEGVA